MRTPALITRTTLMALVVVVVCGLTAGCNGGAGTPPQAGPGRPAPPSASLYTLSPLPMPKQGPPTGHLRATMRQSSRDTLLNRFQVWVDNDTATTIRPTRVTYRSGMFRSTLDATRLRGVPSQSERGFPIYQPARPACAGAEAGPTPTVRITYRSGGRTRTVSVSPQDETDVVGRYTSARCLELAVRQVATLRFADAVPQDPPGGPGSDGHLFLVAHTSGDAGHTLRIDSVTGTPVLSPTQGDAWRPDVRITGDQATQRIDLPVKPTRCDAHAFAESGGATTFLVGIHLDGVAGQLRILMSPIGSKHAIDFARTDCGLLTTIDGGSAGSSPSS